MSRVATNGYPPQQQQQQQQIWSGAGVGAGAGGDTSGGVTWALCDGTGDKFAVRDTFLIGSGRRCDLLLPTHFDEFVAKIERRGDGVYSIFDMQSRDGTFVNNQRLRPQSEILLQQGDRVRFGRNYEFVWQSIKPRQSRGYQEVDVRMLSDQMPPPRVTPRTFSSSHDDAIGLPNLGLRSISGHLGNLPINNIVESTPAMRIPNGRPAWGTEIYVPKSLDVDAGDELFDADQSRYYDRTLAPEPIDLMAARPPPGPRVGKTAPVGRASTVSNMSTPREDEYNNNNNNNNVSLQQQQQQQGDMTPLALNQPQLNRTIIPSLSLTTPTPTQPQPTATTATTATTGQPTGIVDKDEYLTMLGTHLEYMQKQADAAQTKAAVIAERDSEIVALKASKAALEHTVDTLQARITRMETGEAAMLTERRRLEAELNRTTSELTALQARAATFNSKLEEHVLTIAALQKSLRESDEAQANARQLSQTNMEATKTAETALKSASALHADAVTSLTADRDAAVSALRDKEQHHAAELKALHSQLEALDTDSRAHQHCATREASLASALSTVQGAQAQLLARVGAMLGGDSVGTEADLVRVVDTHIAASQRLEDRMRTLTTEQHAYANTMAQVSADIAVVAGLGRLCNNAPSKDAIAGEVAAAFSNTESEREVEGGASAGAGAGAGAGVGGSNSNNGTTTVAGMQVRTQLISAVTAVLEHAVQSRIGATSTATATIAQLQAQVLGMQTAGETAAAAVTAEAARANAASQAHLRLRNAVSAMAKRQEPSIGDLGTDDVDALLQFQRLLGDAVAQCQILESRHAEAQAALQNQALQADADARQAHADMELQETTAAMRVQALQEQQTALQTRVVTLESALAASRAERDRVDKDSDRTKATLLAAQGDVTAATEQCAQLTQTIASLKENEVKLTGQVKTLEESLQSQQEETSIKLARMRDLEGQLNTVQTSASSTMATAQEELTALQSAVTLMRQQRTELQTLVAALQARIAEGEDQKVLREHEKTIAALRRKTIELEGRLTDAKAEVGDQLKQQIRTLEEQLRETQAALKVSTDKEASDKQQQAVTMATLRAQVETKARTITTLQDRLKQATDPSSSGAMSDKDRVAMQRRVFELEETIREKEALIQEKDMLLTVANEGAAARAASEADEKNQLAKRASSQAQELQDRVSSLVKEREEALSQVRSLRASLASRDGSLNALERKMKEEGSGVTAVATAATTCVSAFRDALKQIAGALDVVGLPDLPTDPVASGKIGSIQEDALRWNRLCHDLVEQISVAASGMRAKVEDIPNQLKQVQSTQQAEKAKMQKAMEDQLGALQTKLSRREAVLESYNGDLVALNDIRSRLEKADAQHADSERESARLRAKLEDQQRTVVRLTHELEDSKRLCEELGNRSSGRTGGGGGGGPRPSTENLKKTMTETRDRIKRQGGDYTTPIAPTPTPIAPTSTTK